MTKGVITNDYQAEYWRYLLNFAFRIPKTGKNQDDTANTITRLLKQGRDFKWIWTAINSKPEHIWVGKGLGLLFTAEFGTEIDKVTKPRLSASVSTEKQQTVFVSFPTPQAKKADKIFDLSSVFDEAAL